ncbi:MAG: DUF5305 family protein [Candidatus Bathyarchaeia archaeon]
MKKPAKIHTLLTLFAILTLISILTLTAAHQNPTQETKTKTLCTYTSTATYDYTATLNPNNLIYNNKTTLKPGEGPIYTKITRQITLTLTYTFQSNPPPTQTEITYTITQILQTTAWTHQIYTTPQTTTTQTQIQIPLPPINKTELDKIKTAIDTEIGARTTTYTLEITPTFTINADTPAGLIHQTFNPTLTIKFETTEQGEITTLEPQTQTKTDNLTENQTIIRYDILNQRYTSYILITVSTAGLAFSTYFYIKTKPKTPTKTHKKLTAPYKDLIAETTQQPPETKTTIQTETLQDLAKIAETLAKPILHTQQAEEHIFYVIDNETKYQYKTKL